MKKVSIVVGTRPEAIKMAPVYLELQDNPEFEVLLIATAQHRSMLDQVLGVFEISPDFDLDVMEENQTLTSLTSRILSRLQPILLEASPDAILVHGDTTTCLASALAAFYEGIPIGHVEAGLRTHNLEAPWPEEMNRRLVDPISRWCFAPTTLARENLIAENISLDNIVVTGNTIVDAVNRAQTLLRNKPTSIAGLPDKDLDDRRIVLVTGHRRESFGRPFEEFCLALKEIAETYPDVAIVYPVHLNPNVQGPVNTILRDVDRVHLIDPLEYLPFVSLMERCFLLITDSGGIQEEAPTFGKPVLVTREVTERPEAMEAGLAKLVGMSRERIVAHVGKLLTDPSEYAAMTSNKNPYGDGNASKQIVARLSSDLGT